MGRRLKADTLPVPTPDPPLPGPDPSRPLLQWLLAGDARLTVISEKTGQHFTIKVLRTRQQHERAWTWFIWGRGDKTLGTDPDADYEDVQLGEDGIVRPKTPWFYVGQLVVASRELYVFATRATDGRGSAAITPVNWVLKRIHAGWDGVGDRDRCRLLKSVKCARCRRPLTTPESIAIGLGPECLHASSGS